jgi:hypothetical protein
MRYREFKHTLLESIQDPDIATQTAERDLDIIADLATDIPPENQKIADKILLGITAVSNKIAGLLDNAGVDIPAIQPASTPVPQPVQQEPAPVQQAPVEPAVPEEEPQAAVNEDSAMAVNTVSAIQQQTVMLKSQIEALQGATGIDPNVKLKMIADIQAMIKNSKALLKQVKQLEVRATTAEAEKQAALTFLKEVNQYLVILGNKVQGFTDSSDEELKALPAKERAALKKKNKNAREFTTTLRQALFGKIVDIASNPQSDVTNEEIKQFLAACVNGEVINMLDLVNKDRGNVREYVNSEYTKMFNLFAGEQANIFSYSPGKTSGNIGPGEMALSMMGNPAEKADKGDLLVGDQEIEVKAGETSGGRLNSKQIQKGTAGWKTWKAGIEAIVKKGAPDTARFKLADKKGNFVTVKKENYSANTWNITQPKDGGTGKVKEAAVYNFSPSGLKELNEEILKLYSNFEMTSALFYNTFDAIILNLGAVQSKGEIPVRKLIEDAINEDGSIDSIKMIKAYTRLAYESYHLADGITTIMFLNTKTLDYSMIHDGKDLVHKLGNTVKITSGFNFNDDQQTATPAYLATAK